MDKILNLITMLPRIGIYTVITILSLYFISTDKIYILDQFEHHFPKKWTKNILKHIKELSCVLCKYLKAQIILVLISFVITLVGLYIFYFLGFNIKYPLLISILIGFVDLLPIFGSGTVMIPWSIILSFNGELRLGLIILGLWIAISITRQFIEPRIVSNQIGIHPIFTLIAMYTGYKFIGVSGLLIGPIILIILKNIFATNIDNGIIKSLFEEKD